jgi:hypothetical protein
MAPARKTLPLDQWEDDSTVVTGPAAQRRQRGEGAPDLDLSNAYDAGRRGLPALAGYTAEEDQAHAAGRSDAQAGTQTAPASSGLRLPSMPNVHKVVSGGSIAGFVLGAVAAANVLAFLEYGRPGVSSWWSAKFWNHPTLEAGGVPTAQTGNSTGSGGSG